MKSALVIFFSLFFLFACSDDSSGPGDTSNLDDTVIYFTKAPDTEDIHFKQIVKRNLNTGEESILVDSAYIFSSPINDLMVYLLLETVFIYPDGETKYPRGKIIMSNVDSTDLQLIEGEEEFPYDDWIVVSTPILSPTSDFIIYERTSIGVEGDDDFEIVLYEISTGEKRILYECVASKAPVVSFSNDGNRVAINTEEKLLKIFDVKTGNLITEIQDVYHHRDIRIAVWSPDDSKIVISKCFTYGNYDEIVIVNSDGSNKITHSIEKEHLQFPSFSPDGEKITYTENSYFDGVRRANIRIMNSDGSDDQLFLKGEIGNDYHYSKYDPDGKYIYSFRVPDGDFDNPNINLLRFDLETKEEEVVVPYRIENYYFEK